MVSSVCALLLLCLLAVASAEVLPEQNDDSIDPVKQTGDESDPNDQGKRTIFDSGNVYGIEKHVRLHPSGYKYLLGYRPVRFQLVPVARPLYVKPALWKSPNLQFSAKPVVTLLPPKTVPVFKQNNQWKFGKLPVNVPPSVPLKPWQHEGWTPLNKDNKPFLPSVPLPEPETTVVSSQSPIIPIIPTSVVPTAPVFPVAPPPTVFLNPRPAAPIPTLNTVVPVPAPAVPVQPPVHPFHIDFGGRHLVPINYLPGKLNLQVPNLGVLPLGATVPVQAQPGFVHKIHPQIYLPNQQFLPRFPGGVVQQANIPVFHPPNALPHPVLPPQSSTRIIPQAIFPQPVLSQPVLPQPVFPQTLQPVLPQTVLPQPEFTHQQPPHNFQFPVHNFQKPPPHIHITSHQSPETTGPHNFQLPDHNFQQPPSHIHVTSHQTPETTGPHNFQLPAHNFQQHTPHIHVTSHQTPEAPGPHNFQLPGHNFQFFAQNGQTQFHQETVPQVQPQQPDQGYHYDPPVQQQEYQEPPGFFQPGKTDLQIPGYLPEHPHLRQTFTASQQDPNDDAQNVK